MIDQSQAECRLIVDKPFPMNIYHSYSRGEVATTEKPGREAQGNPVTMSLPGNLTEVGETSNVVSAPEPHF
ncbi:hypothetical protein [Pseudoxanthomonas sp.]|uniref:hypothetical protein n=1 Tax=Pseudoxanthomonas sp. TaxID=1871049 RepID=UPI003F7E01F6